MSNVVFSQLNNVIEINIVCSVCCKQIMYISGPLLYQMTLFLLTENDP